MLIREAMASSYWFLKTEPETYSYADLVREKRTNWNDVRNFQARNFLKVIKKGDTAVIYHSGGDKAVVGIAECVKEGYPDIEKEDGKEWVQIDIKPVRALSNPVTLATIKATPALKSLPMLRQSQLSVMPITKAEFDVIMKLSEKGPK
jgi:predicted RNA-binding protein with PUA-like domain